MTGVTRRQFVGKLAGLVAAAKVWTEIPHASSQPSVAHTEKMRRLRELEAVESARVLRSKKVAPGVIFAYHPSAIEKLVLR